MQRFNTGPLKDIRMVGHFPAESAIPHEAVIFSVEIQELPLHELMVPRVLQFSAFMLTGMTVSKISKKQVHCMHHCSDLFGIQLVISSRLHEAL